MSVSKRLIISLIFILISCLALAQINDLTEVDSLTKVYKEQVSELVFEQPYIDWAINDALTKILATSNCYQSQYFVFVDRNTEQQNIMVGFFESVKNEITIIGFDKVSTGDSKRKGHFITPIGVFVNSLSNPSYRAEGTKNSKGWRGLGKRGSRVWDFGWQWTPYKNEEREIRLLLHATDPDFGEQRLGGVDSKGCVRISAKLNYFLDHYGILDSEYEKNVANGQASCLLSKDRETVITPGLMMIVGESSNTITE